MVIGVGAIGGSILASLRLGGVPAIGVARGDNGRVMATDGLLLRTPDGDFLTHPLIWSGPAEAELHEHDVLVVATKTQQAQVALAQWSGVPVGERTAGEVLPVLMCTNGVASEEMALRYFRRVFAVCVWSPSQHFEAGVVLNYRRGAVGEFHVSRYPAGLTTPEDRALMAQLAGAWTPSHVRVELPDDAMPWKYRKLLSNLGNVFDALVGPKVTGPEGDPVVHDLMARTRAEGEQVLTSANIELVDAQTEERLRASSDPVGTIDGHPYEGSSTWQSLLRATGDIETDYLNGEIARIAHRVGMAAPLNERLVRLGRRAVAEGWRPGDLSVRQLAGELRGA